MGRIAFVFSGQGDQYPGMGRDLAEKYPEAAQIFKLCDRIRPGTSVQCFEGTDEQLQITANTQPCLFAMEFAAASALTAKGIVADAAAGFSLGEMTAAAYCGVFTQETGFRLVCRRGELMQREAEKHDSFMAAVVKLTASQIEALCSDFSDIYPVNFNCPGQVTVSGLCGQMSAFFKAVKDAGGRAIPLRVKGAFHSPFMRPAAQAFADTLAQIKICEAAIPLYSNLTAQPYTADVVDLLSRQICSPVQWEQLVRNMIADGIDAFIEIGPGRTLSNMIRKIDDTVHVKTVYEALSEVEEC